MAGTANPAAHHPEQLVETVEKWLNSTHAARCPPTPPPELLLEADLHTSARKRKRAMTLPADTSSFSADISSFPADRSSAQASSRRSDSPKRRRVDHNDAADDVDTAQSASQVGSESVLSLTERSTFVPPTSRASSSILRSRSPTRETPIILKSASPPVLTESLNGIETPPPAHIQQLGDYLLTNIDTHFIPLGLKQVIKDDADVGYQATKPADFALVDAQTSGELAAMWTKVKAIFLNARDCKDGGRDENAWCDDVFRPLISLAIKLYGDDRWWLQSVQSQSIDPRYLSTVAAPTPADPSRRKAIDRKTDYVLSYSHRHPATAALYKRLEAANKGEVGHTMDAFTKRTALFSGFEIKPASGVPAEAELQISIWSAASIRKKQELVRNAQLPLDPAALVEPMFTIVGHEHHVYYCYPRDNLAAGGNGVHVLGPDLFRFECLSTDSVRGIFRLLRLYGNVLRYGVNEEEDGYWAGVLGKTLTRLSCLSGELAVDPE